MELFLDLPLPLPLPLALKFASGCLLERETGKPFGGPLCESACGKGPLRVSVLTVGREGSPRAIVPRVLVLLREGPEGGGRGVWGNSFDKGVGRRS